MFQYRCWIAIGCESGVQERSMEIWMATHHYIDLFETVRPDESTNRESVDGEKDEVSRLFLFTPMSGDQVYKKTNLEKWEGVSCEA